MGKDIVLSVIIPVYNEEKYIQKCLQSVLHNDYDQEQMEIFVVDGGSSDNTLPLVMQFQDRFTNIYILHNPKKIVPVAMNMGIKMAKGKYIVRLDAHAEYPKEYFSKLVQWHQKLKADNVGTAVVTKVKNPTAKANSIKEVLSHRLGVGNSDFRTGAGKLKEVDTVPFGCYTKEAFEKYGLYDERLIRNQDIELNKRIINSGGKIYLIPDVTCTYYARENFADLAKNNFENGKWNILTTYYTKSLRSLGIRHFIPLLFVLSLLLPCVISIWIPQLAYTTVASLGSYMLLVILISYKVKNEENSFGYLVASFCVLHLSYGLGSIAGIFSVVEKYIKGDR